ncbi:major facilitator superfamily domain-containing protein [Xylogone sp. PMI_703]|nr:major facilitator superfamily domain-containing protein [Xylogone sp. PMI_703]
MPKSTEGSVQQDCPPEEQSRNGSSQHNQASLDITPPYSIFSRVEKGYIVGIAATAAFFSPLSANIYFPVLPELSSYYSRSNSAINLTITVYMIFQGIAPMVSGTFADSFGRRPVYLGLFIIYISACIGIALQTNYAALLVLRCLQSSGSSGMVAIASGVVADVAAREERGSYMGLVTAGANLGPAVGPIIGGLIGEKAGWRWIFWFLTIFASTFAVCLAIFLPETSRNIVGNGSIQPPAMNTSMVQFMRKRKINKRSGVELDNSTTTSLSTRKRLQMPSLLNNLKVFLEKDIAILLVFMSVVYTAYYCILASLPTQIQRIYGYNALQVGLCFIPSGIGCFAASLIGGKLLDYDYKYVMSKQPLGARPEQFPIEAARIRSVWVAISISISCTISYGWTLYKETSVAVPLILTFIIGLGVSFVFIAFSTLLVDLYPMNPSSITATNNLTRCLLGAVGTAVIDKLITAMGLGWCFTSIGFLCAAMMPLLWLEQRYGSSWREERNSRLEKLPNETMR